MAGNGQQLLPTSLLGYQRLHKLNGFSIPAVSETEVKQALSEYQTHMEFSRLIQRFMTPKSICGNIKTHSREPKGRRGWSITRKQSIFIHFPKEWNSVTHQTSGKEETESSKSFTSSRCPSRLSDVVNCFGSPIWKRKQNHHVLSPSWRNLKNNSCFASTLAKSSLSVQL